jgi:hypothetical protein
MSISISLNVQRNKNSVRNERICVIIILLYFCFLVYHNSKHFFTLSKSFSWKNNCLIIIKARFNILRFSQQISEKSDTASSVQTLKDSSYSTTSYASSSSQQQRYQKTTNKSQNNVMNKVYWFFELLHNRCQRNIFSV